MLSKETELLDIKGGEYGADFDRLLNFREIGDFLDMRATEVCLVLLLKHIQSVTLAVKSGNYHFLLIASQAKPRKCGVFFILRD